MTRQNRRKSPPRLGQWLLQLLLAGHGREIALGDFEEVYSQIRSEENRLQAVAWYWSQIFLSVKSCMDFHLNWELIMLKNYVKTAARNIKKQKAYSIINITGLAVSIAVCLFLFLFIDYETGFDAHVKQRSEIYRVVMHGQQPDRMVYSSATPFPMSTALRQDFDQLTSVAQTYRGGSEEIRVDGKRFVTGIFMFVEPQFIEMMAPEWIVEDAARGAAPNSIILTESMAKTYFGTEDPMGRTLRFGDDLNLVVTGVMADVPKQSSLPFDMLISWKAMKAYYNNSGFEKWSMTDAASQAFVQLPPTVREVDLEAQLEGFKVKYLAPEDAETTIFKLQPLTDVHFNPRYGSYPYITSRKTLMTFAVTGFLILMIACINFINLTTARAMKRAREMGMRKVLGANRSQLIRQLMGETGVFILAAMLIALGAVVMLLPVLNQALGIFINLSRVLSSTVLLFFGGFFLFLALANGIYPALVLSRYQPVDALKKSRHTKGKRAFSLRNSLVLFQFVITQILIVATLVITAQVKFIGQKDLGFRKSGILTVTGPSYEEGQCEALRSRWMQNPHVENVSFAWRPPSSESNFNTMFHYSGKGSETEYQVGIKMGDKHYLDVYDIPLLAGSYFKQNSGDQEHAEWVINEEALRIMQIEHPEEALGEAVTVNGIQGTVLGVIKNFHMRSLKKRIEPVVFFNFWPANHIRAQIRVDGNALPETLKYIRQTWESTYPEAYFEYEFLDDVLMAQYESDARILGMIRIASLLAVMIGCLGLLGLVSFVVAQKTKEIGIRKVLGASVDSITYLIARDFLKWVLAANLISWPVAYVLAQKWLQAFAFRVSLQLSLFLKGGALVFVIALLVVGVQVSKAALANPIKAIKYE